MQYPFSTAQCFLCQPVYIPYDILIMTACANIPKLA